MLSEQQGTQDDQRSIPRLSLRDIPPTTRQGQGSSSEAQGSHGRHQAPGLDQRQGEIDYKLLASDLEQGQG